MFWSIMVNVGMQIFATIYMMWNAMGVTVMEEMLEVEEIVYTRM